MQPPPYNKKFRPKLRYAHAGGKNPPVIIIHGTNLKTMVGSYKKYLENFFSSELGFHSTPLIIKFQESDNPYGSRKKIKRNKYKRPKKKRKQQ